MELGMHDKLNQTDVWLQTKLNIFLFYSNVLLMNHQTHEAKPWTNLTKKHTFLTVIRVCDTEQGVNLSEPTIYFKNCTSLIIIIFIKCI